MKNSFKGVFAGVCAMFLFIIFLINMPFTLFAQEEEFPEEEPQETEIEGEDRQDEVPQTEIPPYAEFRILTPEQNRTLMDIRTSTLSELASWCRSLGLSEAGTSSDLAGRLKDHFEIGEQPGQPEEENKKVITIESARKTEYFTIQEIDEDYARLSGEVVVSLKDGDAVHEIKAREILFNKTRNILTASGGVEYTKTEGDKIEKFRGESITVDIDNWSSIFLGGVSERALQSDNTTYLFAGTVISRDEEDVTVLKKASISNAGNEESLWSLNASRVWLLPGSDFAIFNAVLKVGEIPVLYIPFFYFPADEVVFHPVIGSRTREGSFVQTTTYIFGRPQSSSNSESSITKILGNSNDMEKTREGLFLRSTGKKAENTNTRSLKLMLDYYANLGGYIGTDLALPAKGVFGASSLSLGLGFTRTLVLEGNSYTPFYPDYNGETDWNRSNLFGLPLPFRYRFTGGGSVSGKFGSLSWNVPLYSDPKVDSDFLTRSEEMDFVNMIQQGAASMEAEVSSESQLLGNYAWQFSGQLNPKFPNMQPYISSISISGISSTISFVTDPLKNPHQPGTIEYYSPSSLFFFPNTATWYSVSGSISGNPLKFGGTPANRTNPDTGDAGPPDPLKDIGVPRSPFETAGEEDSAPEKDTFDKLIPPPLNQRFDMPRTGDLNFGMDYRLAPSSSLSHKFNSVKWKSFDEVDWDESYGTFNAGGDGSVTINFGHSGGLFSNSFSFSGNGTMRQLAYPNEESEDFITSGVFDPQKVETIEKQELSQTFFSTSYSLTTSLKPLYFNNMFGSSSIQYSLRGLAVKSKFDEEKSTFYDDTGRAKDAVWEMIYGEWNKDKINTHQLSANISASIMDKTQTFTFSAELPPRDPVLSFSAAFKFWIIDLSSSWRMRKPEEQEDWKLDPLQVSIRFTFGTFGSFSQSATLETEELDKSDDPFHEKVTSLTSTLSLPKWGLSAGFTMSRMLGYEFDTNTRSWVSRQNDVFVEETGADAVSTMWKNTGNNILRPRDITVNFSKNFSVADIWEKRMKLSVNTSSRVYFDLQRYTSSNLGFTLGFTLGITKFLDISLSAVSENSVIYRYFRGMFPDAGIEITEGPQNNFFTDLFYSFRFDDDKLRELSGFKMKSFRIQATHYLGDWNATLNWSITPYRPTGSHQYEMNNEVSFLLQWIPISEIKSDISYNKRNDNPWTIRQ